MFAYAGKILRVDLSTGKIETEPMGEDIAKQYIGGIGLGIRLLVANLKQGTDAFSPGNPLNNTRKKIIIVPQAPKPPAMGEL